MAYELLTNSGEGVLVTVPTRYYEYTADGGRYTLTAVPEFLATVGFGGADLSLDRICPEEEGVLRSVLYSFGSRMAAKGLAIPLCHLPFYMPSPDDERAMARFSRELCVALGLAAMLGIPDAVLHPIVRHESRVSRDGWLAENKAFLSPLREQADRLGITLCLENMTGRAYGTHPGEAVYGSRAADVGELARLMDTMVCWDFGHANLTGLCQSAELSQLRGLVRCLHIHDNDGGADDHRIPFECPSSAPRGGCIDWEDAAEGLRLCEYLSTSNRCLDLELKGSDLPADPAVRLSHAERAIYAAKKLARLL